MATAICDDCAELVALNAAFRDDQSRELIELQYEVAEHRVDPLDGSVDPDRTRINTERLEFLAGFIADFTQQTLIISDLLTQLLCSYCPVCHGRSPREGSDPTRLSGPGDAPRAVPRARTKGRAT